MISPSLMRNPHFEIDLLILMTMSIIFMRDYHFALLQLLSIYTLMTILQSFKCSLTIAYFFNFIPCSFVLLRLLQCISSSSFSRSLASKAKMATLST